jgi:predicted Zn-dependent peptidase
MSRLAALTGLTMVLLGCQGVAYRSATAVLHAPPPSADHGIDAEALPSGLRLAVFQLPGQRDATAALSLGAGDADEPVDRPGLATVALRAAMLAPRGRGGGSVLERLYAAGALWRAGVDADEATVAIRCRPAALPQVVDTLSLLLEDPDDGIEDDHVALAREELAGALERGAGSGAAARSAARALALDGTPFHRPRPTPQGVRTITTAEVRRFLEASFAPERSVLWVATGGDAEQGAARVRGWLGPSALGDAAAPRPPALDFRAEPPPARTEVRTVDLVGGAKPRLLLLWRVNGFRFSPSARVGAYALRWLLERRAARKDLADVVESVSVAAESLDRAGVLLVEVGLFRSEDADRVRRAFLEESTTAHLAWDGRATADMVRWRTELRLGRERDLADGWPGPVARLVRSTGSADLPTWLDLNEQSQVGTSVTEWLRAWVDPGPTLVATVSASPEDRATARPGAEASEGSDGSGPRSWPAAPSLVAAAVPGPEAIAWIVEPPGFQEAHRERLPNGLELVVLQRPETAYAALRLGLPGGAVHVSEGLPAGLALRAAREALHLDGCPTAPLARAYVDGALIGIDGPPAWLGAAAESVACWSRAPSAPRQHLPSPDDATIWLSYEALVTGGPLPLPSGGQRWADAYLDRLGQPAGAFAVVVTAGPPGAELPRLREAFGRFRPGAATPTPPPTPPLPTVRRVLVEDVPGANQASVIILLRLPDGLLPTSAPAAALRALLIDRAQRKLLSGAIGVEPMSASTGAGRLEGPKLTGPAAFLPDAAMEMTRELARLREDGPSRLDVERARWDAARAAAFRFDTAAGAAVHLLGLLEAGLPLDGWDAFPRALAAVDAAAVQALLRASAVGAEGLLFRGDAATLHPLLTKAGLTPEVLAPPASAAKPP